MMATCKATGDGAELKPCPAPPLALLPRPAVPATYRAPVREADARENGAEATAAQLRAQLVQLLQLLLLPCDRDRAISLAPRAPPAECPRVKRAEPRRATLL